MKFSVKDFYSRCDQFRSSCSCSRWFQSQIVVVPELTPDRKLHFFCCGGSFQTVGVVSLTMCRLSCQTPKIDRFVKVDNCREHFFKTSIFYVWQGSKCVSCCLWIFEILIKFSWIRKQLKEISTHQDDRIIGSRWYLNIKSLLLIKNQSFYSLIKKQ